MRWMVEASRVSGTLRLPGDKSISHRALMLASLARGTSTIRGLPSGEDVLATAACLRAMGAEVTLASEMATVSSQGTLEPADTPLDAANSGTSMRLLTGLLAGQPFPSVLTGDASLSRRPMGRVIEPLTEMGASISSENGRAPLRIAPARLHGVRYTLPVASAQVKSAVLLAGLFADGETVVVEPVPTRDHTERMLRSLGVDVRIQRQEIAVTGGRRPRPFELTVPGDPSSAAFFFAAGLLTGGGMTVQGMLVNPTRTGFLRALEHMGAEVEMDNLRDEMGEPVADVTVSGRVVFPIAIAGPDVPAVVDELPLLALLATQASGTSTIRGAEELRVKETDRIAGVASVLRAMGADIAEFPDGFVIHGPTPLHGAEVSSGGDHRLAMMLAVAGTAARGTTAVDDAAAAAVSFPGFDAVLAQAGGRVRSHQLSAGSSQLSGNDVGE